MVKSPKTILHIKNESIDLGFVVEKITIAIFLQITSILSPDWNAR
ncbi:MAG TPA: hypothetical protein VFN95_08325 [Flavitalea sp.]|nr:hypothetical protein [Flavitalea sp.]